MWNPLRSRLKSTKTNRVGSGVMMPAVRPAGWWRDDTVEQLRNYQSWVYAAVNAIAQEVARQRPFLFVNTGQADHEQVPLPHTHPLIRLLDHPNPWMTPWELWYLTVLYLELTGNCYWYCAPRTSGLPGELWIVPTPWVRIIPDSVQFVKGYEGCDPPTARFMRPT